MLRPILALLAAAVLQVTLIAQAPAPPAIGLVGDLENDSLYAAAGFAYLTESTRDILSPRNVSEEAFERMLPTIRALETPMYACNLFIPGDLKVVGPEVDEAAVLTYADTVLRRAARAGISLITWGSGGSRRVPEGFSRIRAMAQFVYMGRRVAEVAKRHGVLLALENLNSTECNFINSIPEALAVVRAVDHPNFRLCVDIYHMLVDEQPAEDIAGVGSYAIYSEIAEGSGRTPPGVQGVDFGPYLRALRREGYSGKLMIEARWDDVGRQAAAAYRALREQVVAAYRE